MTVSSSTDRVEYSGNGVTTVFPLPFRFFNNTDIVASLIETATGLETPQILGVNFTLIGAGEPEVDGSPISQLTMAVPPAAGFTLFVRRVMSITQPTDIVNQGRFYATIHENVFDRIVMLLQQLGGAVDDRLGLDASRFNWNALGRRIINVADPVDDQDAATRLWTEQMVGSLIAAIQGPINNSANVLYLFPDGTPHVVQDLADEVNPALGAVGIGWRGRNAGEALDQIRYIETFGATDTPANTKATMQAAINWCASNNVELRARATEYTVDLSASSITIPSNFRCDLGNAWIKRATGNATPHDMWINADTVGGNPGIIIKNVRFDGQRQADSLTNANPAHRFSGLRLVKCPAPELHNVRVNNTVNGEDQVEGLRTALILDGCVDAKGTYLYAEGNAGTGVSVYNARAFIWGVWAKDNTGSGFGSRNNDKSVLYNLNNDGSGYSGISLNGEYVYADGLYSVNTPLGYAGVNIGHDSTDARATGTVVNNVRVEAVSGWGIYISGANNVTGNNWFVRGSVTDGIRVDNCLRLRLSHVRSRAALGGDMRVTGTSSVWVDAEFQGCQGTSITAVDSSTIDISAQSVIDQPCQGLGTFAAGVSANAGCSITMRGEILNSARYGIVSTGAGARVTQVGALITGSAAAAEFTSSGGVITRNQSRKSKTVATSGRFTILNGTATLVVANANAVDMDRIVIQHGNANSRTVQLPRVSALVDGVSFTATLGSNATSDYEYTYVIL